MTKITLYETNVDRENEEEWQFNEFRDLVLFLKGKCNEVYKPS